MKKNKKTSLIDLIDYLSKKIIYFLKKVGRLAASKDRKDSILMVTKIIVTIIMLAFLNIPFLCVKEIGVVLIYKIGASLRTVLSLLWSFILGLSYIVFCLVIIAKVLSSILEDKELNIIEENRRKDTKLKKNIFVPIINFMKACCVISTLPLIFMVFAIMIGLGMNIAFITHGYYIFSTFFILIGFAIILIASIIMIIDVMNLKKGSKKYVNLALIGLIVFIFGIIGINFEFAKYDYVNALPNTFTPTTNELSLKMDDNKAYKILKEKYNENIFISKKVDNSLNNEILIKTTTMDTSISFQTLINNDNKVNLIFANNMIVGLEDFTKIYDMIINTVTSKTLYNYNLLKYSKVEIYGNEEDLEKIEVSNYEQ